MWAWNGCIYDALNRVMEQEDRYVCYVTHRKLYQNVYFFSYSLSYTHFGTLLGEISLVKSERKCLKQRKV